jgi:transcriptional regulator
MLIHPWDSAHSDDEWLEHVRQGNNFGLLLVPHLEPHQAPFAVPTHFTLVSPQLVLCHLARPNPVWPHLERAKTVRFAVTDTDAYVPGHLRISGDQQPEHGVPTSYFSTVQLVCEVRIVDDETEKAALLETQLESFESGHSYAAISSHDAPYRRMLPGIRGVELTVVHVDAKFKYDDHKPDSLQERVSEYLTQAGNVPAATLQKRRMSEKAPKALGPDPQKM